jgi:hypothetical protein
MIEATASEAATDQTSAEAREVLESLRARRDDANEVIRTATARRSRFALAAANGDPSATAALNEIEAEEARAQADARNLSLAIAEASDNVASARAREAAVIRQQQEEQRLGAIAELLELDDELDSALDGVRGLLARREEKVSASFWLQQAAGHQHIAGTLVSYFDVYLNSGSNGYDALRRIAEMDGEALGQISAGVLKRGPGLRRLLSGPSGGSASPAGSVDDRC